MEKQLSSLKWLRERLETYRQGEKNSQSYILIPTWKLETLMVIAEEMHKEEIEKAWKESRLTHPIIGFKHETFEKYYNETFGNYNGE